MLLDKEGFCMRKDGKEIAGRPTTKRATVVLSMKSTPMVETYVVLCSGIDVTSEMNEDDRR